MTQKPKKGGAYVRDGKKLTRLSGTAGRQEAPPTTSSDAVPEAPAIEKKGKGRPLST